MKSFKIFTLMFALVLSVSASSQNVSGNVYYSTNDTRIIGGDLLVTLPSNFVLGVGGSHASKTFFTSERRNGIDFRDRNFNLAQFPLTKYPIETFVEDRGTVSGLVGYSFNKQKTTLVADMGIVFKQTINLFTGNLSNYQSGVYTDLSSLGYQTKGSSGFTYGGTLIQNIKGRVSVLAGYNNIQKFKFGINYRITPTKMFKD